VVEQSLPAGFFVPNSTQKEGEEGRKKISACPDLIVPMDQMRVGRAAYGRVDSAGWLK